MMLLVPMEVDDQTAERLDAIVKSHGDTCTSDEAIAEFLAGTDRESFARAAAKALIAERHRHELGFPSALPESD
jgi:hypothetical protein